MLAVQMQNHKLEIKKEDPFAPMNLVVKQEIKTEPGLNYIDGVPVGEGENQASLRQREEKIES